MLFSVRKIHVLDNINPRPMSKKVHNFLDHANVLQRFRHPFFFPSFKTVTFFHSII